MDYEVLRSQIEKVNKAFYDAVYQDPWLTLIFQDVKQAHIESQQNDFMVGAFGGPKTFSGRNPNHAHTHIYVTEEMWQLREKYLKEAFVTTGFPAELQAKWLKIDEAFKASIIKTKPEECQKRYTMDQIIVFPNPARGPQKKAS